MNTTTTSTESNNFKNPLDDTSQLAAQEMRDYALDYAGKGWKVIPLHTPSELGECSCKKSDCKSVGKHPRTMNGLKDGTTDEAKIRNWWAMWPNANIGIVTGDASGIVVLDVDLDKFGEKSLEYLEEENYFLPETLQSVTGSGGSHYMFAQPQVSIKNSASSIGQGLDMRGDGGYIVAPPSRHKSGNRYEWKNDCDLATMPDWLLQLATETSQSSGEFVNGECIPEGQRNVTLFSLACSVRSRGLDEPEIFALLQAVNNHRCDPCLPESEVKTIVASSCGYEPESSFIQSSDVLGDANQLEKLGLSWGEFANQSFPESEKILFELERGELGMLIAATNLGKTTLSMNLSLLGVVGQSFLPLVGEGKPIRVMYVDGETRQARMQRDIGRMITEWPEEALSLVDENLHIVCDATLDGLPLNLSSERHLAALAKTAREFKPDLIVLDTLSSLFTLSAENDNAEVTNRVMKPLANFAKETNAAVLLLHHVGKQSEESQTRNTAYRARGASALGAAARMTLLLNAHPSNRQGVILHCAKSKGARFEDVVLRLNEETRWFSPTNEPPLRTMSSYERVVTAVRNHGGVIQRKELDALLPQISKTTITRQLREAEKLGDLVKPKIGHYCARELSQMVGTIDIEQMTNHNEEDHSEVLN